MGTYGELASQAQEIFSITGERLKTEQGAVAANNEVRGQLRGLSEKLKGLDQKLRAFQASWSNAYSKSLDATNTISARQREIHEITQLVTNMQLWCFEIGNSKDEAAVEKAKSRGLLLAQQVKAGANKLLNGAEDSSFFPTSDMVSKVGEAVDASAGALEKSNPELRQKFKTSQDSLLGSVRFISTLLEKESKRQTTSSPQKRPSRVSSLLMWARRRRSCTAPLNSPLSVSPSKGSPRGSSHLEA